MSNICSNQNEVFQFYNLMQDGRAFTDFRSQSEVYSNVNQRASNFCKNNSNSYDTRICLQRNAGFIFQEDNQRLNSIYNLPKCASQVNNKRNNTTRNNNVNNVRNNTTRNNNENNVRNNTTRNNNVNNVRNN